MKKCIIKLLTMILLTNMCLGLFSPVFSALTLEGGSGSSIELTTPIAYSEAAEIPTYSEYSVEFTESSAVSKKAFAAVNDTLADSPLDFVIVVPSDGLYTIGISYRSVDTETNALDLSLEVDGIAPFAEAKKLNFSRMWQDEGEKRVDGLGNQFAAKQVPFEEFYV